MVTGKSNEFWIDTDDKERSVDIIPGATYNISGKMFTSVLLKLFGTNILFHSCLGEIQYECKFRNMIKRAGKINTALELGTFKGVSAAFLSYYANKVITIDNMVVYIRDVLWAQFGLERKIIPYFVKDNDEKTKLISELDFDFAFIDDQHDYEGAQIGFEATKKCGRVLFHDYWLRFPGVCEFINTLPKTELVIDEPFAYWEGNGSSK